MPTGRAKLALGVSARTLHRWIDIGLAKEGEHFLRGMTTRSPHRWDIDAMERLMAEYRGDKPSRLKKAQTLLPMIVHGYNLGPLLPEPEDFINDGNWRLAAFVSLETTTAQEIYDKGGRFFESAFDAGIVPVDGFDGLPAKSFFNILVDQRVAKS